MSRKLFLRIVNDILSYTANSLPQHFHFFTSRLDCTGRMSISALMKCTAVIRQFAYGSTANAFDEYLQMSEHTARDALFFFNMCIIKLYMPKYLRKPTSEDIVNIQQKPNNVHGFLGILGTGVNNDINVLDNSSLFDDLLDDLAHVVPYVVNKVEYRNGYYLADGIYSEWASLVKSFTVATDPEHTYFKQRQESAQKDVERAFGVLQGRWGLIQQPARAYEVNTLRRIMGFYENKEMNGVIWCYDKESGVGVGVMLMKSIDDSSMECHEKGISKKPYATFPPPMSKTNRPVTSNACLQQKGDPIDKAVETTIGLSWEILFPKLHHVITGDLPIECDKGGAAALQITRPNADIIDPYSLKMCDILGRIILRPPPEYPQYIKELYKDAHFIDNIRAYNQMFSMTSLGANIDKSINNGKGPYVFRISSQLYH
nr:hypothetical protein [Tanacetum cinerariifolium]